MTNVTLELIWIRDLLSECPMGLYGDNKAAIQIAENDVFHERTKHIEVDCHIVHKKLKKKIIVTKNVSSGHQLALVSRSSYQTTW